MRAPKRPTRAQAETAARHFNESHPVGGLVRYWKGLRQGDGTVGKTRSEAYVTDSGDAVVFIEGVSGYVALTHVQAGS